MQSYLLFSPEFDMIRVSYLCLFAVFLILLRMFHSYDDITIDGDGLQI